MTIKGRARFNDEFARLRALTILQRKIQTGFTNSALALEFNCHPNTIQKNLHQAMTSGQFDALEASIMERLVPKAMDAIEKALKNGDAPVALEIFKGIGLLRKPADHRSRPAEGETESLDIYISRKRTAAAEELNSYETAAQIPAQTGNSRITSENRVPLSAQTLQPLDGHFSVAEDSPSADDRLQAGSQNDAFDDDDESDWVDE